jgi:FK506-binding protein 14
VIKSWDKGLKNMCPGGRRELIIPPALAYGKEGKGIALVLTYDYQ